MSEPARPEYLKYAFRRVGAGGLTRRSYARVAGPCDSRRASQRQEALGLPVVTDGEYRRLNWQVSFSEVEGWDLWRSSLEELPPHPGEPRARRERRSRKGEDAVVSLPHARRPRA